MPQYVDGYLIPVPKDQLAAYRRLAIRAAKIYKELGALEVRECAGEDLEGKFGKSFGQTLKLKSGETAVFSWIVYKSRAQRDRVNAKVMVDPRIQEMMPDPMPFDCKRMVYGGFTTLVLA